MRESHTTTDPSTINNKTMKHYTRNHSLSSAASYLLVLCLYATALTNICCLAAPPPPSLSTAKQLQQPETTENKQPAPLVKVEVSDGNGDAETTTEVDPELVASNIPEKEPSHCDNDGSTAAIANNNEEPAKAAFGDENKLLPGRQMIFGFMPMYVLFPSSNNEAITRSSLKSPSSSIASQQRRRSGPPSATRNNKDEDDDAASMPPPSSPGRPSYGPSSPMRPKMKEDRRRINIITNASPDLFNNRQKNNDRTTDAAAAAGEELQTAPSTTTAAAATTGATDRKPKQKQDAGTIDARPAREETASPLDLPRALPIQQRDKRQFGGYRPDLPYYDPHYGPINYGYPDYYPDYDDYDTDITIYV